LAAIEGEFKGNVKGNSNFKGNGNGNFKSNGNFDNNDVVLNFVFD
jgi:hypothetical protein